MSHYNLAHKFTPMPQAMKIPDAKAAVDKELKKTRDDPSLGFGKSQEQEEVILEAPRDRKKVHFAALMDICYIDGHMSPQKYGVGTNIIEEQRQNRAPGRHCKKTTLEPMQFLLNRARLRPR